MFVDNSSRAVPKLARGRVNAELAIAAVVVETTFQWDGAAWALCAAARGATDPPETADRPLWEGTSVTACGTVHGPDKPPYFVRAELSVAAEKRALTVFGDRVWLRN